MALKRVLFVTCLIISGCGVSVNSDSDVQNYSYELTQNGCETKRHEFSSKDALCDGLKSESLNHGCARSLRADYFKSLGCPGTFVLKP